MSAKSILTKPKIEKLYSKICYELSHMSSFRESNKNISDKIKTILEEGLREQQNIVTPKKDKNIKNIGKKDTIDKRGFFIRTKGQSQRSDKY